MSVCRKTKFSSNEESKLAAQKQNIKRMKNKLEEMKDEIEIKKAKIKNQSYGIMM